MIRIPALVAALAILAPAVAHAQAATGGHPMAGAPVHPWFDWIFFAIVMPWLLLAAWDLVTTR